MKRLYIILSLAAILALALWVKSRWHAWFVSVPETEYSTAQIPDRVTLLPGEDFGTTRIVTWRCGIDTVLSYVELVACGDTITIPAMASQVTNTGGADAFYRAEITDLKPDSVYRYRAVSVGAGASPWYTFRMPGDEGIRKIIYIGDVQDTVGGISERIFSDIVARHGDADAFIFVGDLIEAPTDKQWTYTFGTLGKIASNFPIISAAGNHEYRKSLFPYLDHRWIHTFAYDENGAADVPSSYYIDAANALIVVLDTQCFGKGYTALAQYRWMTRLVAEKGAGKHKILVMHHPPYSVKPKRKNFIEKSFFAPLAAELGFDMVLAGHEHGYGRRPLAKDIELPLYVVSHCSPKDYNTIESDSSMLVIPHQRMYQVIELADSGFRYRAFDAINHEPMDQYNRAFEQ